MSFWVTHTIANKKCKRVGASSRELAVDKIPQTSFQIGQKVYHLERRWSSLEIKYLDIVTGRYTLQRSISSKIKPVVGEIGYTIRVDPLFILPVNNELLAIAHWEDVLGHGHRGIDLIESRGFGSQSKNTVWQKVHHSADYSLQHEDSTFAVCPIEL
ncbi:unnamed protein product [Calypogeia fissa]